MRIRIRLIALFTASVALAVLAGCTAGDSWAELRPVPAPDGAVGAGFLPATPPSPEATIDPVHGSWEGVHPAPGYRVVLITAGDDAPSRTLAAAVRAWAASEQVDLRSVTDDDKVTAIVRAIDLKPDLVISAGNDLVDALATVTASHLDQQFLVVGAEVAEPTHNVTAVDWAGASFRGEGLGASSTYDPVSFTEERCAAAVRAGVASVLSDLTGIVVWID